MARIKLFGFARHLCVCFIFVLTGCLFDSGDDDAPSSLSASITNAELVSGNSTLVVISASETTDSNRTITLDDLYSLLTFETSSCTIPKGSKYCSLEVIAQSVSRAQAGVLSFTASNHVALDNVAFTVMPSNTRESFMMLYWLNNGGDNNNNSTEAEATASTDRYCGGDDETGYFIPQPSYNMPGIQLRTETDADGNSIEYGYAACNAGEETIANNGYNNNAHFDNLIDSVDAVGYAFLLPYIDGSAQFDDGGTDLQYDDFEVGGLCNQDTEGYEVCFNGASVWNKGDANCDEEVCYGSFDAFLNVQNSTGDLEHWISVGGWTYRDYMDYLVAGKNGTSVSPYDDNSFAQNFIKVLKNLKARGIEGIDFDIEFSSATYDWSESLLFQALAQSTDNQGYSNSNGIGLIDTIISKTGLKVSVTIQASPDMIKGLLGNDDTGGSSSFNYLYSWFSQGLSHLTFLTYDNHGVFDYNGSGDAYTGFLSNLFPQPDTGLTNPYSVYTDPIDGNSYDLSVNAVTQYLNGHDGDAPNWNRLKTQWLALVNIGIPAYGRAMSQIGDVTASTRVTNGGLFNLINNATALPGDQDQQTCEADLSGSDVCNSMYSYNYFMSNLASTWAEMDWNYYDDIADETFYIASTAYYEESFIPSTSINTFSTNATGDDIGALDVSSYWSDTSLSFEYNFIAYISANTAKSYGAYASNRGLGGAIVWLMSAEVEYTDENGATNEDSLIYNFQVGFTEGL
ncbi:hypothetical protein [uncultured Shewanella sp.]|uniref:hypothetical protein n=1 Tax=uncultured Shewanella sp. TaxID=173975 RepID=UPI002611A173|nr:hypothetical protein [uncultured Shewanella sp.]